MLYNACCVLHVGACRCMLQDHAVADLLVSCCMVHTPRGLSSLHVACFTSGAYVSGASGSNECPAGSVRIEAAAACRTAAAAAGKSPTSPFVETSSNYPRGCYYISTNNAYFNNHPVGCGRAGSQLLCAAVVTAGAPHASPNDAHLGAGRSTARVCVRRMCTCACSCTQLRTRTVFGYFASAAPTPAPTSAGDTHPPTTLSPTVGALTRIPRRRAAL